MVMEYKGVTHKLSQPVQVEVFVSDGLAVVRNSGLFLAGYGDCIGYALDDFIGEFFFYLRSLSEVDDSELSQEMIILKYKLRLLLA
jgi:hypothetical protein